MLEAGDGQAGCNRLISYQLLYSTLVCTVNVEVSGLSKESKKVMAGKGTQAYKVKEQTNVRRWNKLTSGEGTRQCQVKEQGNVK